MASGVDARGVARRLHTLDGGTAVRRKAAARELAQLDPLEATELVQALIRLAREGWEPAGCVLAAFVAALDAEAASLPRAKDLRRLADVQDLDDVVALFPEAAPRLEMDPQAAAKADAKLFSQSLGYLKTRARRTQNPDELARFAAASNASVVRNVLLNPRMTEALVVRIAARRPARPEPLIEIWRSVRWSARHAVRRALVFNPYLPPTVGAKIVPLLTAVDLAELVGDPGVHETLREQARLLLRRGQR